MLFSEINVLRKKKTPLKIFLQMLKFDLEPSLKDSLILNWNPLQKFYTVHEMKCKILCPVVKGTVKMSLLHSADQVLVIIIDSYLCFCE